MYCIPRCVRTVWGGPSSGCSLWFDPGASHERHRVNRVPMRWGASSFIAQYGLRPEDALILASSPQVLETPPPHVRARLQALCEISHAGPYAFSSAAAPDTETVTSP